MRFLTYFIFFIFLVCIFWTVTIFAQGNNPTKMSQWIYDVYEKKIQLSKNIIEKKIVLVAGSNILFGINSERLSKEFNMPVLNYGVNAGIELPYTLHMAKKVINKSDIVIIPLEYPMYSYDGTPGVQMIDYIFSRDLSYFMSLSLQEQFYMLSHIDLKRVYKGFFYKGGEKIKNGLYGAHNINENGDQINTNVKFRTQGMLNEIITHDKNPEKYGMTFDKDSIGWEYIRDFVNYCKQLNVKVIFMPSTLMKHDNYYTTPKEKWFFENIAKEVRQRGWTYIGNPYNYMYDKSLYFNTNFHLIEEAREIRTGRMIEDIRLGIKF